MHKCEDIRWSKKNGELIFPGLSEACYDRSSHPPGCFCQGRGRVPVDSLEVWLDAADDIVVNETPDLLMTYEGTGFEVTFAWNDISGNGIAPIRLAAIKQAVCRAVGAHEEESDAT